MAAILGNQVSSDLELEKLHESLPLQTSWGKSIFQSKLTDCTTDPKQIRKNQLQLFVFAKHPEIRTKVHERIGALCPKMEHIDECFQTYDTRIQELLTQVVWKRESMGAFLNTSPFFLNTFIAWKTLFLPGFAILMPLLLLVLPFFAQKLMNPKIEVAEYLEHFKAILLKQITVPTFLRPRSQLDRVGFFLESMFIGLTLVMFISSLWNQITASLHLRTIWFDIDMRGEAIRSMRSTVESIVGDLKTLPKREQRGLRHLLEKAERALDATRDFEGLDNVATFGRIWNNPSELSELRDCIGWIDVCVAIASLPNICYPIVDTEVSLRIRNVVHPCLGSCVTNSLHTTSHTILTGPNRGGKSTFCKTVGIAIVLAQSWGFAFADEMTFSPFQCIYTVLEPCGKLGVASTFEAEIEFAKLALTTSDRPMFVMMDEIFHSTNALDGIAASRVFLRQLYAKRGVVSMISTHYTQLATDFTELAKPLQLVATENPDQTLQYTYKVAEGISSKSSVMEILKERGLLNCAAE